MTPDSLFILYREFFCELPKHYRNKISSLNIVYHDTLLTVSQCKTGVNSLLRFRYMLVPQEVKEYLGNGF